MIVDYKILRLNRFRQAGIKTLSRCCYLLTAVEINI
jgi:hypothetical protein